MAHVDPPRRPAAQQVRLSLLLALTTGVPVVLAVVITGWLSLGNGERLVRALVVDLQLEVATAASGALEHTLGPPHLVNDLNADLLAQRRFDPTDQGALQRHFLGQLQRFPSAGYIQLGTEDGGFVGVERTEAGFRVERTAGSRSGKSVWRLDPASGERLGEPVDTVPGYQPTTRPWYRAAVRAGRPTWSRIYQFSSRDRTRLGITAVRPWRDGEGTLLGVLGTDIVLAQLGEKLDSPRLRAGGRVFALERTGELVAHSHLDQPFSVAADGKAIRLRASEAADPLSRVAVDALTARWGSLEEVKGTTDLEVPFGGDLAFVHAEPFRDGRGLDWLIVVALPRADFTPEIRRNTRTTATFCAVAGVFALALALAVSRRVGAPIEALSGAVRALSAGHWDVELPRSRTAEVAELADAFARMRVELQDKEQALARIADRALEAQAEAEAANRAKSSFLANMSHELRTPLNAILGYAELLSESESLSEEALEDLGRIRSAGRHLLGLISDVLDLSRIEAGYLDLVVTRVDGRDLVGEAVETTRSVIEAGGNQVVLSLPDTPLGLSTDAQKARQCLINLLGNAAKFTEDGTVRVELRADGRDLVFEVEDSGVGIPEEKLATIFAPFAQVDGSRTRRQDGAGLGLAITREFARALGGDVTADSEPGRGSRFTLRLPRSGPPRGTTTPAMDRRPD